MGTNPSGLGQVLFGRTRLRLLAWLFGHPRQAFYLSELKRHTGVGQGALQRELATLTDAGLLERSTRGRHVFFTASSASPIFEELRSILKKTSGIADVLREGLKPLGDRVAVAFVFGSLAHGSEGAKSDVDLAVIGEASFGEVVNTLAETQSYLGRDVNPVVYPVREFQTELVNGHHFLNSVMHEPKIFVVGDQHELARLAEERLVDRAQIKRKRSARPSRRARPRSQGQRSR